MQVIIKPARLKTKKHKKKTITTRAFIALSSALSEIRFTFETQRAKVLRALPPCCDWFVYFTRCSLKYKENKCSLLQTLY